jgi:hypothetical protein
MQGLPSSVTQQIGTANVLTGAGVMASFPDCSVTVIKQGQSTRPILTRIIFLLRRRSLQSVHDECGRNLRVLRCTWKLLDVTISTGVGPALLSSGFRTLGLRIFFGLVFDKYSFPGGPDLVGSKTLGPVVARK